MGKCIWADQCGGECEVWDELECECYEEEDDVDQKYMDRARADFMADWEEMRMEWTDEKEE